MAGQARRPHAPVYFNDALFAADVARLPQRGRLALQAARARYERNGVRADERRRCDPEHHSGTQLVGCVKVYIPDFGGRWRIVFQIALLPSAELGLAYVAAGVAHLRRDSRSRDVYELAHFRLHGRWPARSGGASSS